MSKKKLMILILVIILLLAMFFIYKSTYSKYDDSSNLDVVEMTNKNNIVEITSPLSLNDETGRNISSNMNGVNVFYKIKLKNTVNRTANYKVLLENVTKDNSLKINYIKVLLSDKNDKIIKFYDKASYPTLDKIPVYKGKINIYSDKIKANESDELILRMWVSDFYVVNDNNEIFKAKLSVYSY